MARQQPASMPQLTDARDNFNLTWFVVNSYTAAIRPFTRSGMGKRGLGRAGWFAGLWILLYATATESPVMVRYFWAWLAMVLYRQLTTDPRQHTRFQGRVWLVDWFVSDDHTTQLMEIAAVWVLGGWLCQVSEPLGRFVALSAPAFAVILAVSHVSEWRKKEIAHNARFEMREMMSVFSEEE